MARLRKRTLFYTLFFTLLVAVIAMPAFAATPSILVDVVSDSHVDDCGSCEIVHSTEGWVRIMDFSPTRFQAIYHFIESFTNPATGETLWSPNVGPDTTQVMEDGSQVVAVIGLLNRIVIPGEGVVSHDVGRLVLYF